MIRFGLTDSQQELIQQIVINPLLQASARVYVFGSRARGSHQKFSDLDLLIIERKDRPVTDSTLSAIKENAEESMLPFKIDLVRDTELAHSYRPSVDKDLTPW